MTGPVEWAVLVFIAGLIATIAGTTGSVAWIVRGIKADLDSKIMTTATIITDKIAESRHFLRNEMHVELGKLEEHVETQLDKLDANVASVASKLDMHRADDANHFREVGERIARLEAAE